MFPRLKTVGSSQVEMITANPKIERQDSLFSAEDLGCAMLQRPSQSPIELFTLHDGRIRRTVKLRSGETRVSIVNDESSHADLTDLSAAYDKSWLQSKVKFEYEAHGGVLRIADLFCGAGGMSVGINEAARALAIQLDHVLAADIEKEALRTYERNFGPRFLEARPVEQFLDGVLGAKLTEEECSLKRKLGPIDLAVGGPPCQGNSSLNNHTRRSDPKNALYERMARFAEVVEPLSVVIENVPGVRHDRDKVFQRTHDALLELGYGVDSMLIAAEDLGVPQRRHRTVLVASRVAPVGPGFLDNVMKQHEQAYRSVEWAIGDLIDLQSSHPIDVVTSVSDESQRRIDWMFDNGRYDLPDSMRPDCHRTKKHTYKSVYGRLFWDQPAWTVTTGFQVMGQGRFLHPLRRRVITSHEAARLQFFPDFFDFGVTNRKGYAKMIGNAVPSKLAYCIALALLR